MKWRVLLPAVGFMALAGCGSLFESTLPSPQHYVLRLPARTPSTTAPVNPGSLRVQRPEAGPGLESENIALLRSGQRFDIYAATHWAAPAPDLMESVIVDQLRGAGVFAAVFDDSSPYAPTYNLRCELRRFEADYTGGGNAPTIHVALDCTLGRHRDRALLSSFTAHGSAVASADRLGEVVAAFESASTAALGELEKGIVTALGTEQPPAP